MDYDGAAVSLYDSSGRGLFSLTLSESEIGGIARGSAPFLLETKALSGRIPLGAKDLELDGSAIRITDARAVFEMGSDLGLLNVRGPEGQCAIGLRNLRLTAAGPIDPVMVNGIAVFPYSAPVELDETGVQDVLFSGPIVLASEYWRAPLLQRLGSAHLPIIIAAIWMALAEFRAPKMDLADEPRKQLLHGSATVAQRFAVVASDSAVLCGVLGALRALHFFLGGRPPTDG
jgi:hypothetical protein